jgi:hypothetical protein
MPCPERSKVGQALNERTSWTVAVIAEEATQVQVQANRAIEERQVAYAAGIAAMHALREPPAGGAGALRWRRTRFNNEHTISFIHSNEGKVGQEEGKD